VEAINLQIQAIGKQSNSIIKITITLRTKTRVINSRSIRKSKITRIKTNCIIKIIVRKRKKKIIIKLIKLLIMVATMGKDNIKTHMIINRSIMKQLMKTIIGKFIIKSSTQIIMNIKTIQRMNLLKIGELRAVAIPIHQLLTHHNLNLKCNRMRADQ
jgi:hypothetical protein